MKAYNELFEPPFEYPDFEFQDRLDGLIGLDDHKERASKILGILLNPFSISEWGNRFHSDISNITDLINSRPPLLVFGGDVGSGKTELASTIGNQVSLDHNVPIYLYPLSLATRGEGRVGEMTKLISSAFEFVEQEGKKYQNIGSKSSGGIILLVDEADALAQTREGSQMHHEDKAGVNAFIRGIDRLNQSKVPVCTIMCTNRIGALDPAVKRRAAEIFTFSRPNDELRRFLLEKDLKPFGLNNEEVRELVKVTGSTSERSYGFSYSDLKQRLIPSIILNAYPDKAVTGGDALKVAKTTIPTPPFREQYV